MVPKGVRPEDGGGVRHDRPGARAIAGLLFLGLTGSAALARERIALEPATLDLPGMPSSVLPVDLDGDGALELAVVVAYREIGSSGETRFEDRVDALTAVTRVIPALLDRRELRVYRRTASGAFELVAAPMALERSVLHLERFGRDRLVALTDDGLSEIRLAAGDGTLEAVERIRRRPVLAGTETFQPGLELVHDLDGDGDPDVLFPAVERWEVFTSEAGRIGETPAGTIALPGGHAVSGASAGRAYPLPHVRDVDGDAIPDLLWLERGTDERRAHVTLGDGRGGFRPLRAEAIDCHDAGTGVRFRDVPDGRWPWPEDVVDVRDLDGDGRAEVVRATAIARPGDGMRAEMKDAKRPRVRYRIHRVDGAFDVEPEPYFDATIEGHAGGDGPGDPFGTAMFRDLDGDGREEWIGITARFSVLQAVRVLTTKKIAVGLDFRVFRQRDDGAFVEVPDLELSEKLKFDFDDLRLSRLAQFAGDFDGDGTLDFVHFGQRRAIAIHRGAPGARYPSDPDLVLRLDAPPGDLALVDVDDLDGDGRTDLRIVRPLPATDRDESAPVRLDLYFTRADEP